MREILLLRGQIALVDDSDYEWAATRAWYMSNYGYAVTKKHPHNPVAMHRILAGAKDGQEVDHIDGDRLNNQRANLRLCTHAENARNRARHKNNRCGFKGVYLDASSRRKNPWRAKIAVNGVVIRLGSFPSPELAYRAYCDAALRLHGRFARAA